MTNKDFVFTSESVSEGHPDKMCGPDLGRGARRPPGAGPPTAGWRARPWSRTTLIVIAGEITSKGKVDYESVARRVALDIGYDDPAKGFDGKTCEVLVRLVSQSPNISQGGHRGRGPVQGAGCGRPGDDVRLRLRRDRGADAAADPPRPRACGLPREDPEIGRSALPAAGFQVPGQRRVPGRPAASCHQRGGVHPAYPGGGPTTSSGETIIDNVVRAVVPGQYLDSDTEFLGQSPPAASRSAAPRPTPGLTGRKIIVDTYGGMGRHGGGAFSGKGPLQGGPQRGLRGPLRGQERRRGQAGATLRDPARLRHRRCPSRCPSRSIPSAPAWCRTPRSSSSCASTSS